jgi:hypothetical protein
MLYHSMRWMQEFPGEAFEGLLSGLPLAARMAIVSRSGVRSRRWEVFLLR